MAGIYIHIPYCKKKCVYCDFYSVLSMETKDLFPDLVVKELTLRSEYLDNKNIESIYFGGGTPSLLSAEQISKILDAIAKEFSVTRKAEITLEANPDDLSELLLRNLLELGINRLSIGVQSFRDDDLKFLGRRHNASLAENTIKWATKVGFDNVSIDLIYGLPTMNDDIWRSNLQKAFGLEIKHLSCYHLIYEKGTPLFKQMNKGLVMPVNEDESAQQFEILQQEAKKYKFIPYEVSNLGLKGYFSQHNQSYWKQIPYLGLGPSAHSYNGDSREWNARSIKKWAEGINKGVLGGKREILTPTEQLNDYLITSLRTMWGIDFRYITNQFGEEAALKISTIAKKYIQSKIMDSSGCFLRILPKHFFISDGIIMDFLEI